VEGDSTIFDRGSFVEVQSGWARSVIVGRAKIGGIPIGVIVVETRQTHYYQPAGPADPHSQSVARPQAGQVWYPDSAYKTAQAIMDFDREELPLMVLANWRGFSGGQRDMFNEILKFGSYIVDALVVYSRPIFVYLPPRSELRGGAWVVIDSRINPDKIEMYADPTARGGVLEPSGTTEIKFRNQALFDLMMRTDSHAKSLQADTSLDDNEKKAQLNERFNNIKPTLIQIANSFADMHDTPKRMQHVGAIRGIVEWEKSRAFFHRRLKDRLGLK
jgi:acetyl-CoA carboxylase/biotin carboxylase 1